MIESGFFSCNISDRVICIYCNVICQQWIHTDDPVQIHKILSPTCPCVKKLISLQNNDNSNMINNNSDRCNDIDLTSAYHTASIEVSKRHESFNSWPAQQLKSIDNLIKAEFCYMGIKTIVTCFYCNGSIENWNDNNNPFIERVRWFPHCAYI
ncbi:unnamed protein product [Didymodactylos carnosus]|uniref:Uncharacterized protein n=1 Tax=Didymodactylos carnosus TaxID=1234261 RepID=A0A816A6C9_9BILA|nr:unnamed protein product [Didymodactylos carnosus]CAF4463224.1 unnamed protein product [Didymodactylos carnosus]